jgi:hypothetical protein
MFGDFQPWPLAGATGVDQRGPMAGANLSPAFNTQMEQADRQLWSGIGAAPPVLENLHASAVPQFVALNNQMAATARSDAKGRFVWDATLTTQFKNLMKAYKAQISNLATAAQSNPDVLTAGGSGTDWLGGASPVTLMIGGAVLLGVLAIILAKKG